MHRVLVVEDQETLREAILEVLAEMGLEAVGVPTAAEARNWFLAHRCEIVLTDLRLEAPEAGLEVLQFVKERAPGTEVLLMTAFASVEVAVAAMRGGAFDFMVKPFSMEQLRQKLLRISALLVERSSLENARTQNQLLRDEILGAWGGGEIVGQSPIMLELFRKIEKVADSNSSVLILGESGTGKELVARALHERSSRRDRPFVRVHCGALAEGVLESELFGHEKGAFTGATRQHRGRFELADGGTLLLDEIGEISPAVQVKLLRVLQERQLERVGGEETIPVDVRVVAATHRDLEAEVQAGRFRQDLFYRLFVIPLRLPPLRERQEDVPALAEHFAARLTAERGCPPVQITPEALKLLSTYHWPGNVRELENVIERALVLSDGLSIGVDDLPFGPTKAIAAVDLPLPAGHPPLREVVEQVERQLIGRAMRTAEGNKTEAARLLDLKPSVLYYKLEKYGLIDREDG
ncbi:MAG: sigma-54-dependent Fis family transcriptional regulator [Candidatus Eisenbacteria bacterium]|nr:sigma-54-dependent Fis family transcriptional regulator [Candidatus Eisenbacteria bacterium]